MPSAGSMVKTIRFNPQNSKEIEDMVKSGYSYSGAVQALIEGGRLPYGIERSVLDSLNTSAAFCGGSVGIMLREFDLSLNEGLIMRDNERYYGFDEMNERFADWCREHRLQRERVLDNIMHDRDIRE